MEQSIENLVPITSKVKKQTREILESISEEEGRTISNLVSRLLETHPQVQEKLAIAEISVPA